MSRVKERSGFPRGVAHHSAKLTPEQVLEIRKARGSMAKIGRQYGISAAGVGRIKRKESWGWLNYTVFYAMSEEERRLPAGQRLLAPPAVTDEAIEPVSNFPKAEP